MASWSYQVNTLFSNPELFVMQKNKQNTVFDYTEFYMPLNLFLNDACNPFTKSLLYR